VRDVEAAGFVTGMPLAILRGEGLALFVLSTAGFAWSGQPWWLYAGLFLTPDLSFAAYLAGPGVGARVYNALHTTIGPAALAGLGMATENGVLFGVAATLAAHIGFDRMLGYGLKHGTGFGSTHLGRIGRSGRMA
jgi:hypothetical protein